MNTALGHLSEYVKRSPNGDNTRISRMGLSFSFLLDGKDTEGQFSLVLVTAKRGCGPARHMHSREEETLYMLSGEVRAYFSDAVVELKPGDTVFLPRNLPHTYQVISEEARFLVLMAPAGFEEFFREITEPLTADAPDGPITPGDPVKLKALLARYGVDVVGPPAPLD